MKTVLGLLEFIVWLYLMVVFGRLILDWIRVFARDWRPRGVMLVIAEAVYTLTDPPLNALRKVIPPLRLGGASIDLGFLVLVLALYLLIAIL
ncbi:YggT family protein [Knoellia sp. CPCC 206453]|uniref:YggT family protein n=1 Tax=Knoellia pratensis TaxID=3404796 RepID=UPI00361DCE35